MTMARCLPCAAGPTHAGPCVQWRLDHIFFTPRTLQLADHWATLEADPDSAAAGLPSFTCPSDHLPVAATFTPVAAPVLPLEQKQELAARVEALEARQAEARAQLMAVLEAEEKAVAASEAAAAAAAGGAAASEDTEAEADAGGKKKKKKKGGAPPSPAMQAFLRSKRERDKALKAEARQEREVFLRGLGEMEMDALDERVGSQAEWAARVP